MVNHREHAQSMRGRNCTYDSGRTAVPSDNSSDDGGDTRDGDNVHWDDDDPVDADIVNVESDNDANHNNRRGDSSNPPLQRRALSTISRQSLTSDDSLWSLGRGDRYERSSDKENDKRDEGENGLDSGGDVEGNLDEGDTEPLRNQLQQEPTAQLVRKIVEQADSMRVMRAALDRSSQQSKQWSKTYRRRSSSSPQTSRDKQRNPLWENPVQQSKSRGQGTA